MSVTRSARLGTATVGMATVGMASLGIAVAFAPAAAASHGGGGGMVRTGMCSANSDWKLKAKTDNGRLEIEYEVDSNRIGQTWRVQLTDNATSIFTGTRRTVAPSGSFSVRVLTANRVGKDTIVARATNAATGETCRGALTVG